VHLLRLCWASHSWLCSIRLSICLIISSPNTVHESFSIFRSLESSQENLVLSIILAGQNLKNLVNLTVLFHRNDHLLALLLVLSFYTYYRHLSTHYIRKLSLQYRKVSILSVVQKNFLTDHLAVFTALRADTVVSLGEGHLTATAVRSKVDSHDVFHFDHLLLCSFYYTLSTKEGQ